MRHILAASLSLAVAACTCGPNNPTGDAGTDAGTNDGGGMHDAGMGDAGQPDGGIAYDEFDAWREIRTVLRASPDAVPAHADALVAAKDAPGLLALVRDDIALWPTTPQGFDNADTAVRWGARATLRGQAGTPRERAELLKDLYVRAGFTAEVVSGTPAAGVTLTALLAHGAQRAMAYDAGEDALARWTAALPRTATAPPPPTALDADGGIRAAILGSFASLVPPDTDVRTFTAAYSGDIPLVKVTVGGTAQFANPNVDGAVFGNSYTVATPVTAAAETGEHTVHVTLSAARSGAPDLPFTLADHTWNASDVTGRTLTAAFAAPATAATSTQMKVQDVTAFIPMLLVRGDGLTKDDTQALSVIGTPVTRGGSLITVAAGGALTIEGETLALPPTPAALASSVTSLTADVSAVAYPDVELLVKASAGANNVPGLASDAFHVQEDGVDVAAQLRRTRAPQPKVVLLFDLSTSIPPEFVMGAPTVGHDIASALFAAFPQAQVQVAAIDVAGPTPAGPMVSALADVDSQLSMLSGTGSSIYTALDVMGQTQPTCILVITDAVPDEMLAPDVASRLAQGPPVLVAGVGTVDTATAASIATLTHGQSLSGVTAANLAAQVVAFVTARGAYDYRILYRSTGTGTAQRTVTVSLNAPGTASGTAMYTPPASPVDPGALSALYVTVETGGHSVTRLLAGSAAGTAADREAVAGALFGKYVLGIEGGSPSLSTLFDEYFEGLLQLEPGVHALRSKDATTIAQAQKSTFFLVPPDLRFAAAPLPSPGPGAMLMTDGVTVTLHTTRPVLDTKVVRSVDLLPLVPRQVVLFAGGMTRALTTQATSMLAAYEAARFTHSTRAALMGKTLGRFDPLTIDQVLGAAWAGVAYPAYTGYDVYAPSDGSVVAFWAVEQQTGELIGVLPGGGLGEDESTEALVDRLQALLDAAGRAGEALGYEGVKAWADLESTKVGLLGCVIELFEGEPGGGGLPNAVCSAGADALGGQIPGWDLLNMVPGDLEAIYRLLRIGTGVDTPPVTGPGDAACGAILGGS